MGLNIKRQDVIDAARELAAVQGTTMTDAIGDALRDKLEQINHRKGLAKRLRKLSQETGSMFCEPWKSIEHGELLYDEMGLPK